MLERDSQMDQTRFVSTAVQDLNARHNLLSITPNTNKDTIVHKNNFGDIQGFKPDGYFFNEFQKVPPQQKQSGAVLNQDSIHSVDPAYRHVHGGKPADFGYRQPQATFGKFSNAYKLQTHDRNATNKRKLI